MARISVVVPIYEVEDYLEECLRSVEGQTFADLEVVMVDDGSTDGSREIAERFAARDERFRLLSRPNGGLGRARNAGVDASSGDYLAFLDSDDVLPPDAYEQLLRSLDATGSDLATGNVLRLSSRGCRQAAFLARAFARSRPKTHVRRFEPLLVDRTACNKLWRRSFWDAHELRFPAGRRHEDIPVVIPAHFMARSVDVVASTVYHYRQRDHGPSSITQRRHELCSLLDRLASVEEVRDYLCHQEDSRHLWRYERSVVGGDLRYHLDVLGEADGRYRAVFLERANAFLDRAGPRVLAGLPALDRLKWHLVRRGLLPELLELLRFERQDAPRTPPRRSRGRFYGDFPFADDARLRIPRSVYRLDRRDPELGLVAHVEDLVVEHGKLRLTGHAYVNSLGAGAPDSQRVSIAAVRPGRFRPLRLRLAARRLPTSPARRHDLEPDLAWSGFQATLRSGDLLERAGGDDHERWDLFAYVRAGWVRRRRARFEIAARSSVTADVPETGDVLMRATATAAGALWLDVHRRWLRIERHRVVSGAFVELSGVARLAADGEPRLELTRASDRLSVGFALTTGATEGVCPFSVVIPLTALRHEVDAAWELGAVAGDRRVPVAIDERLDGALWRTGSLEMSLHRTATGTVRLLERTRTATPVELPELAVGAPS